MLMATLALAAMGIVLGACLGLASRVFAVSEENPLVKEIEALLPGSQCGQCGFPVAALRRVRWPKGRPP